MNRLFALCLAFVASATACKGCDREAKDVERAEEPAAKPEVVNEQSKALAAAFEPGPQSTRPVTLSRARITRVEIKAVDPNSQPARELYPDLLGKRVGATLAQSGWFADDETAGARVKPAHVQMIVGYDLIDEASAKAGVPTLLAVVEARIVWDDGGPEPTPSVNMLAERPIDGRDRKNMDGVVAEHVERAVEETARGLLAKESLRVGPPQLVVEALAMPDVDLKTWALAMVGERRISAAIEPVLGLLASPDDRVRDAAIGALVALRDPRGVAPLTRLADFSDHGSVRRVLDAVAAIGGSEARDYLEFVATGHPDDGIKRQAQSALKRLERHSKPTPD